ncbi:MAG TPA: 3-phosphoshikimate 1-carboxyvinyltransferase [Armatimonadetes bacterium]|nr:3-phosphoshikimate 1-carboxyvinyltransferase [Armatimonadota bacterium]
MILMQPAPGPLRGTVTVPGSKSLTNRALAVAAVADGHSVLRGALLADDTKVMVNALRQLGVSVLLDDGGETVRIEGAGGPFPASSAHLDLGNAGTAVRFLLALCAAGRGTYVLDGVPRMRERPQAPLLAALRALGAETEAQFAPDCLPVTIHATGLAGGVVSLDGSVSSQYFSALCQAAPLMANGLDLRVEGELVSRPYLDLTAEVMAVFGVAMVNESYGRFLVAPLQRYVGADYTLEPDASSASYFWAAAALTGGRVTVAGLSRASRQGDVRFVDVLAQMGCRVEESAAGLTVEGPAELRGVELDLNEISDTALTLAALAPFATSPTVVTGLAHARAQESDRVTAMATELQRLGARVEELPDGWRIEPGPLQGARLQTYDDHRLAMSLALVGLRVEGVQIQGPECVGKTFPTYWQKLSALVEGSV